MAETTSDHSPNTQDSSLAHLLDFLRSKERIVSRDPSTNRPLLMAIAVMCYLATLALGGVLIINTAADQWTSGLSSTITVQLPPARATPDAAETMDSQMTRALSILQEEPGIISARPLARSEAAKLLEPWLGSGNIVDELPIPQLVDVVIDGSQPPNLEGLAARLADSVPGATLDDHTRWNDRILIFANFLRSMALTVLGLIALCTAAIVVFATRANLAAKQDVVEVLHLIGAHDQFIAREFQYEFLTVGLKGSLLGVVVALMTLIVTGELTQALVGTTGAYLIPANYLTLTILLPLIVIPIAAAAVIAVTTQMTVLNVLGKNL